VAIGSRGATTRCIIRTPDQAIWTFDQETRLIVYRQPKSGEPNAGSAIKKYERAIIPFKARTGKKSPRTRRRRKEGDET